jgi:DNA-binding HxlR family transcriptional regulator
VEIVSNENAPGERMPGLKLVIDLLANKWRLAIIHALLHGTLRYGHLHRALGQVSHKVLTQALRSLERDGIIERRTYVCVPPRVEYSLTPLGGSLIEPLERLRVWAQEHTSEIAAAQSDFDEKEKMWSYTIDTPDNASDADSLKRS